MDFRAELGFHPLMVDALTRHAAAQLSDSRLLVELSSEVTSTLDLQEVLDRSFAALRQLMPFGGGAIQLIDDNHLIAVATDPPASPEALTVRIPVGQGVSGRIAADCEPIYISDIATDERVHPEGRKKGVSSGVRSYFGAPLIVGGGPIGVVQVDAPEVDAFAAGQRGLVLAFMPTIAAAVQNARLYLREREAIERIGEAKRLELHLAQHDPLTGLPNRAALEERLVPAVAAAARAPVAVVLVDLDRFREVNHVLGRNNGDLLLVEAAGRIASVLREQDILCRLGGDVFAIMVPAEGGGDPARAAQQVLAAFERPFSVAGLSLELTASIGWAHSPQDAAHADLLLQRADAALDHAKSTQSGVEAYREENDRYDPERLALLGGLRAAMASGEIHLDYQPIVDLRTGAIRRVEALVRWRHPRLGRLAPAVFVPAVEGTSLIKAFTRHVAALALEQASAWRAQGLELGVAVNVSARNLHDPGFPGDLEQLLAAHDLPPGTLTLELTESAVMADPDAAPAVLRGLGALGARLAIDDFGTGHSSLAYLSELSFHELKIDRAFVAGLGDGGRVELIARATVSLAQALGLEVVAEGIEDEDALGRLAELGCDLGQGYHLYRPASADAVAEFARALG